MVTVRKSRTKRTARRSQNFAAAVLGRPRGVIQPRVMAAGPERFGVVAVDCAKAQSKWMLADFYGRVLLPPRVLEHNRVAFATAVAQLRQARQRHRLKDLIVCVEMTGTYHKPVQRAFRQAGCETRLVHPFASKHYRVAEHGDIKTDDHDLAGIFRAAVSGFGLREQESPPVYQELKILARHRRDFVNKRAKLQCQIRHQLQLCLPGFADLFAGDDLWTQATPLPLLKEIAARGGTSAAIAEAGVGGVSQWLRSAGVRFHQRTIERVVVWAAAAAMPEPLAAVHTRVWQSLLADWEAKQQEILAIERELPGLLAQTPYLLMLSHPGINVVSAAELAGEMGPIEHYAAPAAVRGRAGLFPSRYQSDGVDRGGNLSRFRNARLRAAYLLIADNMVKCNAYWRAKAGKWKAQGVDPRDVRCRIAGKLAGTVFQMVSGGQLFRHPSRLDRSYVMEKLWTYHREHKTPPHVILRDLKRAAVQLPPSCYAQEAEPLQAMYEKSRRARRGTAVPIGDLLVGVLARLGVSEVESE
jgi:transposase